jgi:hypothetical protein
MTAKRTMPMTANEVASVTGVPLRQVHRIIDAGLLDGAVKRRGGARLVAAKALTGLKLAHETAGRSRFAAARRRDEANPAAAARADSCRLCCRGCTAGGTGGPVGAQPFEQGPRDRVREPRRARRHVCIQANAYSRARHCRYAGERRQAGGDH